MWGVFHVSPDFGGKFRCARYEISANQRDHVVVRFCRMLRARRIVHFRVENVKNGMKKRKTRDFEIWRKN